jgi:hypothetical protein
VSLDHSCLVPTANILPINKQIPELTNQKVKELSGKLGISAGNENALKRKTLVVTTKMERVNGSFFITPAPAKARMPQKHKIAAIVSVTNVGYQSPCSAICAIVSLAPNIRYQSAPNTIHPK